MKPCRICSQEKSLDDFYVRYTTKDGHDTVCKSCHKARVSERRSQRGYFKSVSVNWKCVPRWLTTDQVEAIAAMYTKAKTLSKESGIPMVVDHIVPLRGKHVCGLHVPGNLRIVTRRENTKKGNKEVGYESWIVD
jgi:hypothetical protein